MNQKASPAERTAEELRGPLKIGSRYRKYEIVELIGQGGYASVYRAHDTLFKRDVAIKVIHRIGGATEDMMRRGQAEAAFLSNIRHPNIVQVVDADIMDNGLLCIVMERLVGRALSEVIGEHRRLAVEEALAIAIQVADAVEAAHQLGAIHRDLKPENIFITAGNNVKVLDFGIAKFVNDVGAKTTAKDALQGSVLYMSPEHVQGIKVGPRTDIYSLGIMLYEIMLGVHPVRLDIEERANAMSVANWHIHRMPRPLCDIAPWVPTYVSRFISTTCAKFPGRRPESMGVVAQQARTVLERFVKETKGELKGQIRELACSMTTAGRPFLTPLAAGTSQQFVTFTSPAHTIDELVDGRGVPATSGATIPGTGQQSPSRPAPPASKPTVSAAPSIPRMPQPHGAKTRRRTATNAWLFAIAVSGAVLSGALTKAYYLHKRQANARPTPPTLAMPDPQPSSNIAPEPSLAALPGEVRSADVPKSASSEVPAMPRQIPTVTHKVAAKPKKLTPSELRLKALEDELARQRRAMTDPNRQSPRPHNQEP